MIPPEHPWQRDPAEVAAELHTDLGAGLTAAEAARRLQRYGRNELEREQPLRAWRRFLGQFADPLIYLLMGAAVVAIAAWAFEAAGGSALRRDRDRDHRARRPSSGTSTTLVSAQLPLGPRQRLQRAFHRPLAVGRDRALAPVAGRGRRAAVT